MKMKQILKSKKGVSAAIVDFYVALFIFLFILLSFFVMGIRTDKITWDVHGESLALDATQIALLYAQTTAKTSHGNMTIAAFLAAVARDDLLEGELEELTKQFFDAYAKKMPDGLSVKIIFIRDEDEDDILYYENYDALAVGRGVDISPASNLLIPLRSTGDFARIDVRTVSTAKYLFKTAEK